MTRKNFWVRLKSRLITEGVQLDSGFFVTEFQKPHYSIVASGIELVLPHDIRANTPINPLASITLKSSTVNHGLILFENKKIPVRIQPHSPYLHKNISCNGKEVVADYVHLATDRVNIWAVENCAYNIYEKPCLFCDVAYDSILYQVNPLECITESLKYLLEGEINTIRHVQVSGGTPRSGDWQHFLSVCRIAKSTKLPLSVMTSLVTPDWVLEELELLGAEELSVNLELSSSTKRQTYCPGKYVPNHLERLLAIRNNWSRSIRSTLIVGLEPAEDTLKGVKDLCEMEIIPVLSPFRPAPGTPLEAVPGPSPEFLADIFLAAEEIAYDHGLFIGPSCPSCQHNVMALPLSSQNFWDTVEPFTWKPDSEARAIPASSLGN